MPTTLTDIAAEIENIEAALSELEVRLSERTAHSIQMRLVEDRCRGAILELRAAAKIAMGHQDAQEAAPRPKAPLGPDEYWSQPHESDK